MKTALFLFFATALVPATADTVLIDYDDGIPGNGIHESSLRNGGFEDADGTDFATTPFWDSYFAEGDAEDPVGNTDPHTGSLHSMASGWADIGTGDPRVHPSQTIPAATHTIAEGDTFSVSLWVRMGAGMDAGDGGQCLIHVVDASGNPVDDGGATNPDRLLHLEFDLPDDGSYAHITGTSNPVPAGSNWIGNRVRIRILAAADRNEFMIFDDLSLIAVEASTDPTELVARYNFDGDTLDSSGNGHNGSFLGAPSYGAGFGIGASFAGNGSAAAVSVPHSVPGSTSIAFWLKTTTPGTVGDSLDWSQGTGLVDGSVAGPAEDIGISLHGARIAFGAGSASGTATTIFSQTLVTDGAWHHVVATRDSATGQLALHIDSQLESTDGGPAGNRSAPNTLRVGSLLSGGGYFTGLLDDLRIHRNLLTSEEIEAIRLGTGDTDGDGQPNSDEAIAGTSWGERSDYFRIHSGNAPKSFRIDGKRGRNYKFWRSPDLADGSWAETTESGVLESDQSVDSPTDPADRAFYRASVEQGTPPQPNVIILVTDDQGYADLSAYTHSAADISTPSLDRIAAGGVLITNGYITAPVCSPSRAGWATGRHQQEWDPSASWSPGLPSNVTHVAAAMKAAGYITGMVGKNDYGDYANKLTQHENPANHGYDTFLGFTAHAHDFWLHSQATADATPDPDGHSAHLGPLLFHNFLATPQVPPTTVSMSDGLYLTDIITDRAIGFLDSQAATPEPFLLTVCYNSVHHLIHEVPQSYLDAEGLTAIDNYDPHTNTAANPDTYAEYYNLYNDPNPISDGDMRKYYRANLACLDDNVGRLLDRLDTLGIADDTMIIFFGDNGGSPLTGANNTPLAGSKYNLFEGGIRVPFMVRWPGRFPAGTTYHHPVSALDVMPTCLDVADAPAVPNLRGHSLVTPLRTGDPVVPGERAMFWKWQSTNWAVRKGDWKLVKSGKGVSVPTSQIRFNEAVIGTIALFNLATDPGETTDLSGDPAQAARVAELQSLYKSWADSL